MRRLAAIALLFGLTCAPPRSPGKVRIDTSQLRQGLAVPVTKVGLLVQAKAVDVGQVLADATSSDKGADQASAPPPSNLDLPTASGPRPAGDTGSLPARGASAAQPTIGFALPTTETSGMAYLEQDFDDTSSEVAFELPAGTYETMSLHLLGGTSVGLLPVYVASATNITLRPLEETTLDFIAYPAGLVVPQALPPTTQGLVDAQGAPMTALPALSCLASATALSPRSDFPAVSVGRVRVGAINGADKPSVANVLVLPVGRYQVDCQAAFAGQVFGFPSDRGVIVDVAQGAVSIATGNLIKLRDLVALPSGKANAGRITLHLGQAPMLMPARSGGASGSGSGSSSGTTSTSMSGTTSTSTTTSMSGTTSTSTTTSTTTTTSNSFPSGGTSTTTTGSASNWLPSFTNAGQLFDPAHLSFESNFSTAQNEDIVVAVRNDSGSVDASYYGSVVLTVAPLFQPARKGHHAGAPLMDWQPFTQAAIGGAPQIEVPIISGIGYLAGGLQTSQLLMPAIDHNWQFVITARTRAVDNALLPVAGARVFTVRPDFACRSVTQFDRFGAFQLDDLRTGEWGSFIVVAFTAATADNSPSQCVYAPDVATFVAADQVLDLTPNGSGVELSPNYFSQTQGAYRTPFPAGQRGQMSFFSAVRATSNVSLLVAEPTRADVTTTWQLAPR